MNNATSLRAIDFFCGAGGLTYGLRASGIIVIAGIDNDEGCRETYERNNPGSLFLAKDIAEYQPLVLEQQLRIKKQDDNVVFAGCAPCQYWSVINTSKEKSSKTKDLILHFQRFVEYFTPGYIIVENVPGISFRPGSPLWLFIDSITSLGYNVAHGISDMSLYGVPQTRRRFTLIASRVTQIELPKPTNRLKTVRDVLGERNGFPRISAGIRDQTVRLHTTAGLSSKNLNRLKMTPRDGGDRSSWPNTADYQLACYASGKRQFYDTYGRMWWDRPAPTITTKFFGVSHGRFGHPEEDRAISLREGATLQTFPKAYHFSGRGIESIAKMIGNAVPPHFAKIIGRHLIKTANKR